MRWTDAYKVDAKGFFFYASSSSPTAHTTEGPPPRRCMSRRSDLEDVLHATYGGRPTTPHLSCRRLWSFEECSSANRQTESQIRRTKNLTEGEKFVESTAPKMNNQWQTSISTAQPAAAPITSSPNAQMPKCPTGNILLDENMKFPSTPAE